MKDLTKIKVFPPNKIPRLCQKHKKFLKNFDSHDSLPRSFYNRPRHTFMFYNVKYSVTAWRTFNEWFFFPQIILGSEQNGSGRYVSIRRYAVTCCIKLLHIEFHCTVIIRHFCALCVCASIQCFDQTNVNIIVGTMMPYIVSIFYWSICTAALMNRNAYTWNDWNTYRKMLLNSGS